MIIRRLTPFGKLAKQVDATFYIEDYCITIDADEYKVLSHWFERKE